MNRAIVVHPLPAKFCLILDQIWIKYVPISFSVVWRDSVTSLRENTLEWTEKVENPAKFERISNSMEKIFCRLLRNIGFHGHLPLKHCGPIFEDNDEIIVLGVVFLLSLKRRRYMFAWGVFISFRPFLVNFTAYRLQSAKLWTAKRVCLH